MRIFDKTTLLVTKLLILKMMVGQGNKWKILLRKIYLVKYHNMKVFISSLHGKRKDHQRRQKRISGPAASAANCHISSSLLELLTDWLKTKLKLKTRKTKTWNFIVKYKSYKHKHFFFFRYLYYFWVRNIRFSTLEKRESCINHSSI